MINLKMSVLDLAKQWPSAEQAALGSSGVLLFGGFGQQGTLGDLWQFKDGTYAMAHRLRHTIAHKAVRRTVQCI